MDEETRAYLDDLRGAIEGLGVALRSEMVDMREEMRRHFGVVAERFDQDIATTAEQMARLRIDLTREIDSRIEASAAVTRAGFRVLQRQIDSLRAQG